MKLDIEVLGSHCKDPRLLDGYRVVNFEANVSAQAVSKFRYSSCDTAAGRAENPIRI